MASYFLIAILHRRKCVGCPGFSLECQYLDLLPFKNHDTKRLWFDYRIMTIFIDREAREIMYLVASVRPSVRLRTLSRLNRLTYDLDILYVG